MRQLRSNCCCNGLSAHTSWTSWNAQSCVLNACLRLLFLSALRQNSHIELTATPQLLWTNVPLSTFFTFFKFRPLVSLLNNFLLILCLLKDQLIQPSSKTWAEVWALKGVLSHSVPPLSLDFWMLPIQLGEFFIISKVPCFNKSWGGWSWLN